MIDKEILDKTFKQITEENRNALATGFQDLDILLSGVEKGNLITIGARPAMGKTAFILSIMSNLLKQNKKCLLFSLEMSTSQIIKRLIAILGEIGLITMNHNKLLDDSQKSKIEYILTAISYLNLTICDDIYTIEGIRNKIAEERPEYVFIDYLQLMETPRKKQRSEAITNIMLDLKQIAKENNCIIFISSQLSRALESRCDKRPMLSDLRESGDIENISDVVLLIYRDEYYKACVDDEDYALNKGKAEIIVAKNKMGATAIIELLFRSPIAKFLEPIQYDLF
ncbi:TPA: hypothetical protein CPT90_10270 [Candidatus Gastranaerophilales bacterium HUM_3]|jgi:DNA helicase, phage-associated|nr:MAG TPA: hypothetical protein CPT90_10270 [Candidatus Gastranaerophilales bacterium HUM_3]